MLILKGNFLKGKFLLVLLILAAGWFQSARLQAAAAATAAPHAVAAEFYVWYLETLGADQDPLSDRYERFTVYVSRDLAGRLVERLRGGRVPDSDYFLQDANYHDAWLRQPVRAVTVARKNGRADVVVTLGEGEGEDRGARQRLTVAMTFEGGGWKIRHVNRALPGGAESSTEQPVI